MDGDVVGMDTLPPVKFNRFTLGDTNVLGSLLKGGIRIRRYAKSKRGVHKDRNERKKGGCKHIGWAVFSALLVG